MTRKVQEIDGFGSRRSTVYAERGMVATSQPLAAQAGIEILRDGGNAFDAAVATAAALNVVEPTSTGLGGDVFALYHTAAGEVGAMRACGGAAQAATRDRVREAIAEEDEAPTDVQMPMLGPHTVTVPGTARGWEATVEQLGTKSLASVLKPAIHYATKGYPASPVIADAWSHAEELFENENAREAYLIDGERAPEKGEVVQLPKLGASMQRIAEKGADTVYTGEIGEAIVQEVQEAGGFLSMNDLRAFEVEWPTPVSTTYRGTEIWELPPNNQGLIALEALNVAEELGVHEYDADDPERYHYLAEAMAVAFEDGHRYITDPEFESHPPLGDQSWANRRAADIGSQTGNHSFLDSPAEDADTVLLCVADDKGNLVSYINSRFAGFGSGLVAGDTGIALQNRGASFSLDSNHPNRLAPGKRPFHTLVPAVAQFDQNDWAAFGVMGGYMQPQGHLQLLTNILDCEMGAQAALDAPRWRYREDGSIAVEATMPAEIQHGLLRRGHEVAVLRPPLFGGAQFVRNVDGILEGATEPRKDGISVGF
jgi:gamma-glutamyltranspeptidase/glutathione hydrolase